VADRREIIEIKFDLHHKLHNKRKCTKIWTIDFLNKFLNLKNLSSAGKRTARLILAGPAGACYSYVSYVHCVHCISYVCYVACVHCVAYVVLDGKNPLYLQNLELSESTMQACANDDINLLAIANMYHYFAEQCRQRQETTQKYSLK